MGSKGFTFLQTKVSNCDTSGTAIKGEHVKLNKVILPDENPDKSDHSPPGHHGVHQGGHGKDTKVQRRGKS